MIVPPSVTSFGTFFKNDILKSPYGSEPQILQGRGPHPQPSHAILHWPPRAAILLAWRWNP